MASSRVQIETKQQQFRWSFRKKGKDVLKLCRHLTVVLTLTGGVGLAVPAQANPAGGNVTAGSATISSSGSTLTVNQTSQRTIIEWASFDIDAGETTRFVQPNSSSLALNRVVNSNQASAINGNLQANGRVLVINPNGVLIGPSGNVDVSGFVASTADIDNTRFMTASGAMEFDRAGKIDATVENKGRITIRDAGLGLLVAPVVRNSGVIQGNMAQLQMGAGDTFGVDLYGDGLLHLAVASNGPARSIKAENTGTIVANAGKVVMTAAAANNVVNSVINTTGVIEAKSLVSKGGKIVLTGAGADVKVAGKVDASGKTGGGEIKIGGDVKGADTLAKAATVDIAEGAEISADAMTAGDGGTVAVWSEDKTTSRGSFTARGGEESGNGGFVETSSKGQLDVDHTFVDTSAANGSYGKWLLDPFDLDVGQNLANTIRNSFTNVTLYAIDNLNVNADLALNRQGVSLELYAQFGDVNINGRTITLNGGDLVVDAGGQINLKNSVVNTNGGDVGLYSYATGNNKGINIANSSIFTKGGDVGIYGKGYTLFGYAFGNNVDIRNSNINTTGGASNASVRFEENGSNKQANQVLNNSAVRRDQKGGDVTIEGQDITGNRVCIAAGGVGCGVDIVLNVQAHNKTKTYGAGEVPLTYVHNGLLSGYSIVGALVRAGGNNVGSYDINQGSLNAVSALGLDTYVINYTKGTLTINPALLTITAKDQSKTYGDVLNLAGGGYEVSGLKYNDAVNGVTLTSAGAAERANAGDYAIEASGATGTGLSNYTFDYVDGKLTVNKASLHIAANNQTKVYGADAIDYVNGYYTATGLKSWDSIDGTNGQVMGGFRPTDSVGTYDINVYGATGTGLSNYNITFSKGTLTVTKANLVVTANDQSKTYGSAHDLGNDAFTVSGLKNSDTVDTVSLSSAGAAATANAGTYDIDVSNASGSGLGNYIISYVDGLLTVDKAKLTLTANNQTKTVGTAFTFAGNEFTTAGALYNGDTVTGATLTSAGAAANASDVLSPYAIAISNATGTGLGNYDITYVNGQFTVNPLGYNANGATASGLNRPVMSLANKVIQQDTAFEAIETRTLDTDLTLRHRGGQTGGAVVASNTSASALAALEPAAGGDATAEQLADLEPAAGGNDTPANAGSDLDCANSFLDNRPCGVAQ